MTDMHKKSTYVLIFISVLLLISCSNRNNTSQNDSWMIGPSVSACFEDDGNHGYVLKINGSGALVSDDFPWASRAGRISSIEISEGITSIGSTAFISCTHVKQVVLPESVLVVAADAFNSDTCVFAYKGFDLNGHVVYVYSEAQPEAVGDYWHLVNGEPVIWQAYKVLFIGNSFTYYWDIEKLFENICLGAGVKVEAQRIAIGSHTLSKFADPKDEGGAQVETALTSEQYDFIILQDQSTRSYNNPDLFSDGIQKLVSRIGQTQKKAKVYLYETWGFPKSANGMTIPEMEGRIRASYEKVASEVGSGLSYVGKAFTKVYESYPVIDLIHTDQQHPSYAGSFLSACVHAATIFGIDPRVSDFDGKPIPQGDAFNGETASILKQVAYEIVFGK